MSNLNRLAAIEKAIQNKYGKEAIQDPRADWTEENEKDFLQQTKEYYSKIKHVESNQEKIDRNGIKISKKLLNRESLNSCCICSSFSSKSMDDVCLVKFGTCYKCYIQYIDGREERWLTGWRPDK
jgi:hypothetical protein